MKQVSYYPAGDLNEAHKMLSAENCEIIAGGTDLLPRLRLGIASPSKLIDISQVRELKKLECREDTISIGATVTLDELINSSLIRRYLPSLVVAAKSVASWQIRNRGTLAGNICQDTRCHYYNQSEDWRSGLGLCFRTGGRVCYQVKKSDHCVAVYYSDLAPILAALGASVILSGPAGESIVRITDLPIGPGISRCHRNEVMKEFIVPKLKQKTGQVYLRESRRGALDFPLCNVGVVVNFHQADGLLSASVILGAVAPSLCQVDGVAKVLNDRGLNKGAYEEVAEMGAAMVKAVPDYGYSTAYRRDLARILIRRGLTAAVQMALDKKEC